MWHYNYMKHAGQQGSIQTALIVVVLHRTLQLQEDYLTTAVHGQSRPKRWATRRIWHKKGFLRRERTENHTAAG